jgi:hypothetical protein
VRWRGGLSVAGDWVGIWNRIEHAFAKSPKCLADTSRCGTNQTDVLSNIRSTLPEERP